MPDSIETAISSSLSEYKTANNIVDDVDADVAEDTTSPEVAAEATVDAGDPEAETPETAVVLEAAKPAEAVKLPSDDELGPPEKNASGRDNPIPYSRVKKIVANTEKKLKAQYEGETAAATAKYAAQETRLAEIGKLEDMVFEDQDRYIGILENIPGYKEKLAARYGGKAPAAAEAAAVPDEMPGPDTDSGYSTAGFQKVLDWHAAQVTKQIEARYKPLEEQNARVAKEREIEQAREAVKPRIRAQIAEMQKRKGFNENEAAILTELKKDGRLSLEGAYMRVMQPKWDAALEGTATDRNKIREELLAELKKAPTSTSTSVVPGKSVAAKPKSTGDSMEDAIRASLRAQGL